MKAAQRFVYFAYGSNLNKGQMRRRCKTAVPIGRGVLRNVELTFRGKAHVSRFGVADIVPWPGGEVPVGIWLITERDLEALDRYEGYPHIYTRYTVRVETEQGYLLDGLVYMMPGGCPKEPSKAYLDTIRQGYTDFGLDPEPLEKAVKRVRKEVARWQNAI